jgi:hypothetical protein
MNDLLKETEIAAKNCTDYANRVEFSCMGGGKML